jgi:hypothetical protein
LRALRSRGAPQPPSLALASLACAHTALTISFSYARLASLRSPRPQLFAKYGDPDFDDIEGTINKILDSSSDQAALISYLSSDFSRENPKSDLIKSIVLFGTPLHNASYYMKELGLVGQDPRRIDYYNDEFIEVEEAILADYMTESHEPFLNKEYNAGVSPSVSYTYIGYSPLEALVAEDMSKILVSMVFVASYMWYSVGSFFVAFCGMTQIFCSFFGANLVYRFLWPTGEGFGFE